MEAEEDINGGITISKFSKTVCTICYEDLKPITEDLQSISICGHVFHELCLQQWFEYAPGKKISCPVCQQKCTNKDVVRLYFPSLADSSTQATQRSSLSHGVEEKSIAEYKGMVAKLETQLSHTNRLSAYQKQCMKELMLELNTTKDHLVKEVASKAEVLKEKTSLEKLLNGKMEEIKKCNKDIERLHQRTLTLAEELSAHKLVSNLDLGEEEMTQLASVGRSNSEEVISTLRKSLILRNKNYKELMAQCNRLGTGELHAKTELGKANEKIKKLKARLKEVEIALEGKDNEELRALKKSKKNHKEVVEPSSNNNNFNNGCNKEQSKRVSSNVAISNCPPNLPTISSCSSPFRSTPLHHHGSCGKPMEQEVIEIDREEVAQSPSCKPVNACSSIKEFDSRENLAQSTCIESKLLDTTSCDFISQKDINMVIVDEAVETCNIDDDDNSALDDLMNLIAAEEENLISTNNDKVRAPEDPDFVTTPGERWLHGSAMTSKSLSNRWRQNQSAAVRSESSGDLIAVGADGRGGTIKVLKNQNLSLVSRDSSAWPKPVKRNGIKQAAQSKGCLQIEHFFQKVQS